MHTVTGFTLAGTHSGLKPEDRPDMALVVSDRPCTAAGIFTTNRVKAAPVLYDQGVLAVPDAAIRAVLVNTGSANACTGDAGLENARQSAIWAADAIGCAADEVLVLSTGVIGLPLPMDCIARGIESLNGKLKAGSWQDAARAIMTTDTRPKVASVRTAEGYTITGIAKGAGMIAPNMATMLSVIATDAQVARDLLDRALRQAADASFNRIVVDGDMSTNDTVLALANGASGVAVQDEAAFVAALSDVAIALAQAIVRDGEGATKFVTVQITGAASEDEARTVARSIATSALVKTAFYGGDPNWGRILCAAGYSGAEINPATASLWLLHADGTDAIQLVAGGQPLNYDEPAAIQHMQDDEWGVRLDLGQGDASTWVWTCDISHEYVTINGHYRT
ncbi:bifunctional glutamate N-acetyltransferase/amino-acid acetyltransferase ArgJ [Aggregatilinea sp.]|uniref:bifunctional glutamate N-acetyltransferase/amino-acid acetyltransferase ArgJ n=1 Tax=Aggregatilinea sp. TaxID=2806333 RepID=UPI0032C216F4